MSNLIKSIPIYHSDINEPVPSNNLAPPKSDSNISNVSNISVASNISTTSNISNVSILSRLSTISRASIASIGSAVSNLFSFSKQSDEAINNSSVVANSASFILSMAKMRYQDREVMEQIRVFEKNKNIEKDTYLRNFNHISSFILNIAYNVAKY